MGFYQDHIVPHLVNLAMRNRQLVPYRERIVSAATGRVLEIGIGSGLNLPFYTDRATEVLGIEPNRKLLAMAARKHSTGPGKGDRRIGGINSARRQVRRYGRHHLDAVHYSGRRGRPRGNAA